MAARDSEGSTETRPTAAASHEGAPGGSLKCTVVIDDGVRGAEHADALFHQVSRLAPVGAQHILDGAVETRLELLVQVIESSAGPVLLLDGRLVTLDSPLVDVLADPRPGSTVLVGVRGESWPARTEHGVVLSASSPFHEVRHATTADGGGAGGAMRVAVTDRHAAAQAVRSLIRTASSQEWSAVPLVPLVLVALARAGVRVFAVAATPFVATVDDNSARCRLTSEQISRTDEHRVRLAGAARPRDGFYSTFVVRRVSRPLTGLALRIGLTPNQVTLLSLLIAAMAAVCFALGERGWLVAGAILLQLSLVVDCVDGELARYTRQHSALGAWLDAGTDRIKEFAVYAALAIGAGRENEWIWLLACALLAEQATRHFVDFGFAVRQAERLQRETTPIRLPLERRIDEDSVSMGEEGSNPGARLGRSAAELSDRTNRVGALVWAKRVVIMPIGERWLVISVATALSGPRLAFALLLVLGAVAAVYTTTGRLLRSAADREVVRRGAGDLLILSDAGLLAGRLGQDSFVGRFAWIAPALSRLAEYGGILALTWNISPALMPLAYAYLFVLALWHYDAVYRLRFTALGPPVWAQRAALGVPVRLALLIVAGAAGDAALGWALVALGVLVLPVTLVDSTVAWRTWLTSQRDTFTVPRFRVVGA